MKQAPSTDPGRLRRPIAAVLLVISAFALQRSATLVWARAEGSDGSLLTLSPVGLSRIARDTPSPASTDCRWWPRWDKQGLCVVQRGGEAAFGRLRSGYPLIQVALWLSVAGLFLVTLRVPRPAALRAAVCWGASLLSAAATHVVRLESPAALAALQGLHLDFRSIGFTLACLAAVTSLIAGVLEFTGSRTPAGERPPR